MLRTALVVPSTNLNTVLSFATFRDNSLLHFAVENAKSPLVIGTLLEHGYDPDVRNKRGETLLWLYMRKQNLTMMVDLMRYGANPELAPNKRPPLLAFLLSDSKAAPEFVCCPFISGLRCLDSPPLSLFWQIRPATALLLRAGADPSPFRSIGMARMEELYPECECLDAESASDLFLKEAFGKWLPGDARAIVKL